MSRFSLLPTPLAGLIVLERAPVGDQRGFFERVFCTEELQMLLTGKNVVQINHTLTAKRGTVRGLHFQHPPHAETKFVTCLRGEVFDVAVDLRQGSPTFLHWYAAILRADNFKTMVIPEGFAHGFQTLSDDCEMLYLHTAAYQPAAEDGVHPQDPMLAIDWPEQFIEMSLRDTNRAFLTHEFSGVLL